MGRKFADKFDNYLHFGTCTSTSVLIICSRRLIILSQYRKKQDASRPDLGILFFVQIYAIAEQNLKIQI